jgi:uncharacterized RDD family membrane protein YckC
MGRPDTRHPKPETRNPHHMIDESYDLRTPEQVDLSYDLAGLGSRCLARLIDSLIQVVLIIALMSAFALGAVLLSELAWRWLIADTTILAIVGVSLAVLLIFVVWFGYDIFFELAWNGQTPGKRAAGIRVLTTRGEPVTLVHVLVRNLLRFVDMLPSSYIAGMICMLLTRRSQRLGDIAAGTIVVHERRDALPRTLAPLDPSAALPAHLAVAFNGEDVALARDFLLRAATLTPSQRQQLSARITATLRRRLIGSGQSVPPDLSDERLLLGVAALRK